MSTMSSIEESLPLPQEETVEEDEDELEEGEITDDSIDASASSLSTLAPPVPIAASTPVLQRSRSKGPAPFIPPRFPRRSSGPKAQLERHQQRQDHHQQREEHHQQRQDHHQQREEHHQQRPPSRRRPRRSSPPPADDDDCVYVDKARIESEVRRRVDFKAPLLKRALSTNIRPVQQLQQLQRREKRRRLQSDDEEEEEPAADASSSGSSRPEPTTRKRRSRGNRGRGRRIVDEEKTGEEERDLEEPQAPPPPAVLATVPAEDRRDLVRVERCLRKDVRLVLFDLEHGGAHSKGALFTAISAHTMALAMSEHGVRVIEWYLAHGSAEQQEYLRITLVDGAEELVREGGKRARALMKSVLEGDENVQRVRQVRRAMGEMIGSVPDSEEGTDNLVKKEEAEDDDDCIIITECSQ